MPNHHRTNKPAQDTSVLSAGKLLQTRPFPPPISPSGEPLQAKLTIGEPNDKYEQEADRVAHDVVQRIHENGGGNDIHSPSGQPQTNPLFSNLMQPLQRAAMQEERDRLQKKSLADMQRFAEGAGTASAEVEQGINSARGGGQRLAPDLQTQMGQAMEADFSKVRVHTDARADMLNRSVGARAFTTGQDLFFKQGEYQPKSSEGQKLIAHELTHVVQQNGSEIQPQRENSSEIVNPDMLQRDTESSDSTVADSKTDADIKIDDDEEMIDFEFDVAAVLAGMDTDTDTDTDDDNDDLDVDEVLETIKEEKLKQSWLNLSAEQIQEVKIILDFVAKLLEVREVKVPDSPTETQDAPGDDPAKPSYSYLELIIVYIDRLIEGAKQKQASSGPDSASPPGAEEEGMKQAKGLRKALSLAHYLSKSLEPLAKVKATAEASPVGLESLEDGNVKLNVLGSTVTFSPSDQKTTVDFPAIQLPRKPFELGAGIPIPIAPGVYIKNEIGLQGSLVLTPSQSADIKGDQLQTEISGKGSNIGVFMKVGLGAGLPGVATVGGGLRGDLLAELGTLPLGHITIDFTESSADRGEIQFNLDATIKGIVSIFAEMSLLKGLIKKEYKKDMGDWKFGELLHRPKVYSLDKVELPTESRKLISQDKDKTEAEIEKREPEEDTTLESKYQEIINLYKKYGTKDIETKKLDISDVYNFTYLFLINQAQEESVQAAFRRVYPDIDTDQSEIEVAFKKELDISKALGITFGYNVDGIQAALRKAKTEIAGKESYLAAKITNESEEKESPIRDIRNAVYLLEIMEQIEAEVTKIENAYQAYLNSQPKSWSSDDY